ncbi:DUF544-domain-containing protein [Heliocybe sulcata]|uniref:DUF544-domain-containing protein n=1 Tax=Heliocybe sulcata TaxID=5364 RepID=A0A5C3MXZ9_9AGAM|nr:DUF544-domain-containing protein [Heliocybe sulcata]
MATNPSIRSSQEDVWYLKEIVFGSAPSRRPRKIITQNFNGPCSFIAICNILLLRDKIEILPPDRTTVSYEMLSQLVAEYLLMNCPDVDISAALSIMPKTTKGMDLNPVFTGASSFRPAGDGSGGELKLFEQADIKLVHGWLVDPDSPEHPVVSRVQDYDSAVNLIVEADVVTQGRLVGPDGSQLRVSGEQHEHDWSEEQRRKVEDAIVIRSFLDSTQSQLTYYGLFHLASTLPPDSLVALFRNSHLSVLYKSSSSLPPSPSATQPPAESAQELSQVHSAQEGLPESSTDTTIAAHLDQPFKSDPSQHSYLYSLVTDFAFLHEPTVVWERLEDVGGGLSTFVDSSFRPSAPAGGDFAGLSPEEAADAHQDYPPVDLDDQALAQRLQAEEDAHAQQMRRRQQEEQRHHAEREQQLREMQKKAAAERERHSAPGLRKKPSCIIM